MLRNALKRLGLAPTKKALPSLAVWGALAFIASCAATGIVSLVLYSVGLLDTSSVYAKVVSLPVPVLLAAFTFAPLGEEAFFRGFLFRWIEDFSAKSSLKKYATAIGAVVSSLIFAILHAGYGSIAELAVAFAVGLILCWFARRTRSLVPGVLAHAAFNCLSILINVVF
jgi:membrane protease YdiL (CAAX protease family)